MRSVHTWRNLFRINALCLAALVACLPARAQKTIVNLDREWEFRQRVAVTSAPAAEWRPATVPGDVHLDLLANKLIPEPFYRDNEAKLHWIQDADWEYRTHIDAPSALLARRHVDIVFEGLDAYAEVYLNGQKILVADNMFRDWRVDVKPYLKAGANDLLVVFPSPIKAAQKIALTDVWHGQTPAPDKTYIRKAAYEYGWDWGPTFVTSGIWRPARLEAWDDARVADFYPRVRDVTKTLAHVDVELDIVASEPGRATISIGYQEGSQSGQAKQTVGLLAGQNHVVLPVEIDNPHLWYPAGYGAQPIYHWNAKLTVNGKPADEAARKNGLRSIVIRRDLDKWGRSFELVVNDISVFGKGADVIPFDSFPSRVTTAQYRRILESARDANMNMVRHWGGGYYETDEFYDICDELGIMVWQDFMFGNDWQPGPYWFRENVEKEAEYQVTRLRNHPSIVVWCGNNETEISLAWDRNASIVRGLSTEARVKIWQDYLLLFSGTLPRVVERLAPETPYWPSSPSADYEDLAPGKASGDMHDWMVWHGRVPFSEYEKHYARFMTEYGFQSFPEMKTIDAFTAPEDRTSIFTPVMLAHQKNNEGNSIIHDYLLKDYSEPKDFASFLYVSQVLQAEGIKIGAEHMRRSRPRTMGSIYWQLNDCWPVASWSSVDYYGRWKALQYYARRFYSPVLVSPHVEDGALAVYIVSDKTAATDGELRLRIMKFDGTVVREQKQMVHVPELSSAIYLQLPLAEIANAVDPAQVFVAAELTVNGAQVSNNLIYLTPTKLIHLPPVHIQTEISAAGGGYRIRLTSPVLARSVYLSFRELNADVSDNYFDLLPNEPVDITVKTQAQLDTLREKMTVVSLVDAFAPAPAVPVAPQ
ncbi:MAG: glycoside hydrolase family 2 protein [Silvibacterium sp.]|nr:glycoside hydrolase family 2 protein [Silvibacterium sp.]